MDKFSLVEDPAAMPRRIFGLPELHYPDRLNITRALFESMARHGWTDRTAYYCNGDALTYGGLIALTRRTAAVLVAAGVRAGDAVIIRLPDTPDLVAMLLAIKAIGAVAVPTFVQLRRDDIVYRAEDTGARHIVVSADLVDEIAASVDALDGDQTVVVLPADPTGWFLSFDDLAPADPPEIPYADTHADDLCLIVYTSGTTGRPKGTTHCHRDLMATGDTFPRYVLMATEEDVFAGPPALPFTMGMSFFMYYPLRFGAASILSPDKSVEAYLEAINAHGATIFISVPTYYHRLLRLQRDGGLVLPPTLRIILCAGEPLYPEIEDAWAEEVGRPMTQLIGTTEMFHAFIGFRYGIDAPRRATLGTVCPGYEVTVRDPDTFEEVPRGEHGLMCVRGPTATVYWSPREVQREAVRDGWTIVQDTIWMDGDGFVHFVGRRDEMIISGGLNIAPTDVERVLVGHPAVAECACVASPDESGERSSVVKAFVVAAPGHAPGDGLTAELQDFFKRNGPPFMYPRKIEFIDSLPKSLTGKVQRSVLRRRETGA